MDAGEPRRVVALEHGDMRALEEFPNGFNIELPQALDIAELIEVRLVIIQNRNCFTVESRPYAPAPGVWCLSARDQAHRLGTRPDCPAASKGDGDVSFTT